MGDPFGTRFAFASRLDKFANKNIRPTWRNAWRSKEEALRQRFHRSAETLSEHSRELRTLQVGDRCYIQNQTGNFPKRWDRSGTIVDVHDHDSYTVKVDGTGSITRRNRFLRRFVPATSTIDSRPPYPKVVCLPNDALHSPAPAVKPSQRVYSSEHDAPNTDDSLGYRQSTDSVPLSPLVLQECNPSAHTEVFPTDDAMAGRSTQLAEPLPTSVSTPPSVLHLHLALVGWYDHLEDTNLKLVVGCDGRIRLRRTEGGCIVMDTTCIVMDTIYSYVIIFLYFIDPNIYLLT